MTEHTPISVALIDDDSFLLQMYGMKFKNEGYSVQTFASVNDALKAFREGFTPEVIAFDLTLPEHDGFSLLESLRQEKLVPLAMKVALTNQQSESEKVRAHDLGADMYIIKATMIPSEVVNTVRTALSARKAS